MDVNGCHIVSILNENGVEGFSSVVSRYVGIRNIAEYPDGLPEGTVKVSKGPFFRQRDAIKYAISWSDAEKPPAIPPADPMDINGCKIISIADEKAVDGVVSNVTREIVEQAELPADSPAGTPMPEPTVTEVSRGPFDKLVDAIAYARSWVDAKNPPALPSDTVNEEEKPEPTPSDSLIPSESPKQEESAQTA